MCDAASPTIALRLNGQTLATAAGATLADLLALRGEDPMALATAVNGVFVPRELRVRTALQTGDDVTFFKAITGG